MYQPVGQLHPDTITQQPTIDKQIGQLGAITPAVTFVVAPLWGALADGTGRHKDVLLFTFITSVISRLLFIWRVRSFVHYYPD